MSKLISLDKDGKIVYEGMLSSQEKADIDEILYALKQEIPQIEKELAEKYGPSVWYKYYLGMFLSNLLERFEIPYNERRKFWDEIKNFATETQRKRDEGKAAVTRSFYEQCYALSRLEKNVVEKLTWRQWQDLLDRKGNREDPRIFSWIGQSTGKIGNEEWREFEKALNLYLKNKDTSVFSDEELYSIYDSLRKMVNVWQIRFKEFAQDHPQSAKIKNKAVWSKRYYQKCFKLKKEHRTRVVTPEICENAFNELMK